MLKKKIPLAFIVLLYFSSYAYAAENTDCTALKQASELENILCTDADLRPRYERWVDEAKVLHDAGAEDIVAASRAERMRCEDTDCLRQNFDAWDKLPAVIQLYQQEATQSAAHAPKEQELPAASQGSATTEMDTKSTEISPATAAVPTPPPESPSDSVFFTLLHYLSTPAAAALAVLTIWLASFFINNRLCYAIFCGSSLLIAFKVVKRLELPEPPTLEFVGIVLGASLALKFAYHWFRIWNMERKYRTFLREMALQDARDIEEDISDTKERARKSAEKHRNNIKNIKGKEYADSFYEYALEIQNSFFDNNKESHDVTFYVYLNIEEEIVEKIEDDESKVFYPDEYDFLNEMQEIVDRLNEKKIQKGDCKYYVKYVYGKPAAINKKVTRKGDVETWKYHQMGKNRYRTRFEITDGYVTGFVSHGDPDDD